MICYLSIHRVDYSDISPESKIAPNDSGFDCVKAKPMQPYRYTEGVRTNISNSIEQRTHPEQDEIDSNNIVQKSWYHEDQYPGNN